MITAAVYAQARVGPADHCVVLSPVIIVNEVQTFIQPSRRLQCLWFVRHAAGVSKAYDAHA
jgi:hypothetical protein